MFVCLIYTYYSLHYRQNGTRSCKSKGKDEEFEHSFLNIAQNHSNWKIHKLLQLFNFGTIMRKIYVILKQIKLCIKGIHFDRM
jgi:hypothetical protein